MVNWEWRRGQKWSLCSLADGEWEERGVVGLSLDPRELGRRGW